MTEGATGQIIDGLRRFEALLPDWTEQEGGEDGWEQSVAWWTVAAAGGLVLIDPLVDAGTRSIDWLPRWRALVFGDAMIRTRPASLELPGVMDTT